MGESKSKATTLAVLEKMHEIVTVGKLDRNALRAAFGPKVTDFQFNMAFYAAKYALESEGYFIKPNRKEPGVYLIATAEDVTEKVVNKSRVALVDHGRRRMKLIQHAQKHPGMDQEAKTRLQTEELLYGRTLQFMERALLKSQRKKPEGLE
jgi:hypothetical protein